MKNVREGFFEKHEFEAVRAALPEYLRGVVTFAYFTGWRTASEILPLRWSNVDRERQVITLAVGSTKSGKGRTLPDGLLPDLVDVVDTAWKEHERLLQAETICPFVFHRHGKSDPRLPHGGACLRDGVLTRSRTIFAARRSGIWCERVWRRKSR